MKPSTLCVIVLVAGLGALPLAAQNAGQSSDTGQAFASGQSGASGQASATDQSSSSSGDDMFNSQESVTQTTPQTQNAAPREELLKEAAPRITGTFTSKVGLSWNWANVWNTPFDVLSPTSHSLNEEDTGSAIGFVARPDTDISITGEIRSNYPFVQQITTSTGSPYTVPNVTVWSLYSKFTWNDSVFFTFGQQPIKWGTGYFFSPSDDVFAQTAVDVTNPTAERQGPLALKVQYPIPHTLDNLYFIAALPVSDNPTALASVIPEDIAVAAKAEFLFGNTEVAAAGYFQRQQRPQAILMATTGINNVNFFGEGVVAFQDPQPDPYFQKAPSLIDAYTVVDRSKDILFSGTAGAMYTNSDWNFTLVGQYLYNGAGYDSINSGDILLAVRDRGLGQPPGEPALSAATLFNYFSGLGKIGKHYGVLYASWTSIFDSKTDVSLLALANFSDGSGFVNPTVTVTMFTYVKVSGGVSLSWGGNGSEFADPTGFSSIFQTINGQPNPNYNPHYVAEPTMALTLNVSFGTTGF
jgi:hypothetical protein